MGTIENYLIEINQELCKGSECHKLCISTCQQKKFYLSENINTSSYKVVKWLPNPSSIYLLTTKGKGSLIPGLGNKPCLGFICQKCVSVCPTGALTLSRYIW